MRAASFARFPLPRVVKNKGGYFFVFCIIIVFFQAGLFAGHRSNVPHSSLASSHPIPDLMNTAEHRYRHKLRSQSRTLTDAVHEYRRRYARDPPRGFDAWWRFAEDNAVVMRDEYDAIVDDLSQFWLLSPAEIRNRVTHVASLPSINLVRVQDGNASLIITRTDFEDTENGARAQGFVDMLAKFVHLLPDMDFPINAKAEGRVLVPWEHTAYSDSSLNGSFADFEAVLGGPFRADWDDDGNVWDAWRRTCPPSSPARRVFTAFRNHSSGETIDYLDPSSPQQPGRQQREQTQLQQPRYSFTSNTGSSTLDFCQHPHLRFSQGHFFSDWRTIGALFPVFSPAKARGFGDIRVPSHYYYTPHYRYTYGWDESNLEERETDRAEVRWEDKEAKVFWRGATTGGGSHPPGWMEGYQRHRFVRMTSSNSTVTRSVAFHGPPTDRLLSADTSSYVTVPVPLGTLNAGTMDAAFVAMLPSSSSSSTPLISLQTSLQRTHRFADAVLLGEHWRYKYLIDMDGMGYSGRFMAFLASGSVPLKATVYEEWWSAWLEPWLHYIPLSHTYEEIYDIYAYFSGPTKGMLDAWRRVTGAYDGEVSQGTNLNPTEAGDMNGETLGEKLLPQAYPEVPRTHSRSFLSLESRTGDDRRLRRIAVAGQVWKRTVGRKVDMEAYVYRLALEWARLVADDREEMGFKL